MTDRDHNTSSSSSSSLSVVYGIPYIRAHALSLSAASAVSLSPAIIALNSLGVITALDDKGQILWQDFDILSTSNSDKNINNNRDGGAEREAEREVFRPRILRLSLSERENREALGDSVTGPLSHSPLLSLDEERETESERQRERQRGEAPGLFLLLQEHSLHLLDHQGKEVQRHSLPAPLLSSPSTSSEVFQVLDLDSDGESETLVLRTTSAVLAYHLSLTPMSLFSVHAMIFPLCAVFVVAVLLFVAKVQYVSSTATAAGVENGAEKASVSWWRSVRATDTLHLD